MPETIPVITSALVQKQLLATGDADRERRFPAGRALVGETAARGCRGGLAPARQLGHCSDALGERRRPPAVGAALGLPPAVIARRMAHGLLLRRGALRRGGALLGGLRGLWIDVLRNVHLRKV